MTDRKKEVNNLGLSEEKGKKTEEATRGSPIAPEDRIPLYDPKVAEEGGMIPPWLGEDIHQPKDPAEGQPETDEKKLPPIDPETGKPVEPLSELTPEQIEKSRETSRVVSHAERSLPRGDKD
jgi:hypothetical protein